MNNLEHPAPEHPSTCRHTWTIGVTSVIAMALTSAGCGGDETGDTAGTTTSEHVDACDETPAMLDTSAPVGRVVKVSIGLSTACAVFEDGSMRCWGDNQYGQIGDGTLATALHPKLVAASPKVRDAGVGTQHVCSLSVDQCAWCWGDNSRGQLGSKESYGSLTPMRVHGVDNIVLFDSWGDASVAFLEEGRVVSWGSLGFNDPTFVPTNWANTEKEVTYRSISLSSNSACRLRGDARVECWGENKKGQLGTGDNVDREVPTLIPELEDVIQISLAGWNACAVRSDKSLWCWGSNILGQVGDGTTMDRSSPQRVDLDNVEDVALGSRHACARTAAGRMWCWGENVYDQIGNGAMGDIITEPWGNHRS